MIRRRATQLSSNALRTFFVAVFFFGRLAPGRVAHPLLFAAVEAVVLGALQLEVFAALVERHQEQFLALSTPAKRENEIKTKFGGKHTRRRETQKIPRIEIAGKLGRSL